MRSGELCYNSAAMDAILTHENADFDALAALLGAKKCYPEAIAVLPRRLNRNVRDFCTLYGDALALTRQEDLPRRHLKQVVLVDTQNPPSARGIKQDAQIHIVDHHPLTRELKKGWTFCGGEVGATTTLFVEEIREKELPLAPIEATLLLLGIYEDTGSLLYVTTTARDVNAAAFLLESGASLAVVNDFLHHPLTAEQRALYQKLLERVQTVEVAGHAIAIAAVRADQYTEEVSTLAHQIRELYDPAALFLLVQMDDHIQMVARSDHAAIDVAEIAEQFGGGGHDKAAAALIPDRDLRATKSKLLKLLKEQVKPAVTVRELMSFGVHTLEPDTTVTQAAEMMRRYGHEGFPVVRRGKLVGVLTRREIDRALHHQLSKAPIKSLMHKPVSVAPADSLEKLRTVMIESDLGQVPVVEDNKIVGIVTRTDLIKRWEPGGPSRSTELAARLEKWLPPELSKLLHEAGEAAHELGCSLYIVGGFVRDLLLNQPNLDLDLVVDGDAIELARRLAAKYGGRVHGHTRFGTAKWLLQSPIPTGRSAVSNLQSLDFTTARTEFYAHPSALPEVERSSIKQDLRRRDFTINTLAVCLVPDRYGQLLDPFGGEADLQRGLIRVLHNLSFVEDPTRMLRAARLEQRLDFKIEKRTAELMGEALDMLHRVTGQRIKHELILILQEREPEKALARLNDLGVLKAIYPAFAFDAWHAEKFRAARETAATPITYLSLLCYRFTPREATDFALRLKLTNAENATLHDVLALRDEVAGPLAAPEAMAPSAIYRLLEGYGDAALAIFALAAEDERVRARIELYRTRLRQVAPELTGDDLKQMGIPPGPRYRKILMRLRAARLDGEVSSRAEEEALVRSQLSIS
ncbi:MAG: CBS domain-containing protein [Chloroflexi bacterium]|nr:CBS domain-containing protein [Chloroflexota bacterium]